MPQKNHFTMLLNSRGLKILTFLFALISQQVHAQPYQNLVFEGGGIRGISYAGALSVLEKEHITDSIKKVAGTSVGAITAVLMAVGYTSTEIHDLLFDLDIQKFNDGKWFFLGGQHRLRKHFGWYKGDRLEEWIGKLIATKTGNANLSFAALHTLAQKQLQFKDLYVTACNLSEQKTTVFSYTSYPDMMVKTAVRASLSIPLYFSAVLLDSTGARYTRNQAGCSVFVDGGLTANYPLFIFDGGFGESGNPATLGLKLERPEQIEQQEQNFDIAGYQINSFTNYVSALYNLTIEITNRQKDFPAEKRRTIYISTGNIKPRVRRIATRDKQVLYDNGVIAALKFLKENAK